MIERIDSYDFIKSSVSIKKHVPVRIGTGLMTIEFKDRDFKSVDIKYSDFNYESEKRKEEFLDYFSDGKAPNLYIDTEVSEKFKGRIILIGYFGINEVSDEKSLSPNSPPDSKFHLVSTGMIEYHFSADQEFWDLIRLYENLSAFFASK